MGAPRCEPCFGTPSAVFTSPRQLLAFVGSGFLRREIQVDQQATPIRVGCRVGRWRGQPSLAHRRYERAPVAAERQPDIALPVTADMHVGLADMLREQTEIDAAAAHQQTTGAISLPPATPRPTSSESPATSTTRSCASDSTTNAHSRTSDAIATSRGWPR